MKVSHRTSSIAPLAVALAMVSGAARAEYRGGACRQDIQKLCADAAPGPGIRDCLQQHADALSPDCQARLTQKQAKVDEFHQACAADLSAYCSGMSERRAIGKCLHQHRDELSQSCQDVFAEHHGHRRHHHQPEPTPAA